MVNDYGRFGEVIDLRAGQVTMALDNGGGYSETVPFSLVFHSHRGRDVVVHRTAWNRLDVSDPASGELLTSGGPTSYRSGEPRPDHYLDYFPRIGTNASGSCSRTVPLVPVTRSGRLLTVTEQTMRAAPESSRISTCMGSARR